MCHTKEDNNVQKKEKKERKGTWVHPFASFLGTLCGFEGAQINNVGWLRIDLDYNEEMHWLVKNV